MSGKEIARYTDQNDAECKYSVTKSGRHFEVYRVGKNGVIIKIQGNLPCQSDAMKLARQICGF